MKGFYFLTLLTVIFSFPPYTFSQTGTPNVNASPAPVPTPETVTYKDLLEFQERKHAQELQVQKEIADRAIQVAGQQAQTVLVIVETGAFLLVLASAVVGWWVKRQVNLFQELNKQSADVLSATKIKLAEIENDQSTFSLKIETMTQSISPLESKVQQFSLEVEKYQESLEDVSFKARLAEIRARLRSDRLEDRLIATQAASEIAKGERGATAVPLLLECLSASSADPPVVAEALYGLAYRAKDLIEDKAAIELILATSQSPEKMVRKQALETIRKIGLTEPDLLQRVKSCYESDVDDEVRELAGRILSEDDLT